MIEPQDEQTLQRLLSLETLPDDVQAEYRLRSNMYHRSGSSGPLGPIALIDLVRFLKRRPPEVKAIVQETDWRTVRTDGSVRVECKFFGDWQGGVFLGFVQNGTLAVRLDNDPMIRECHKHVVRIAAIQEPPAPPEAKNDIMSEPVETIDVSPVDPDYQMSLPSPDGEAPIDWSEFTEGDKVWVALDSDIQNGSFINLDQDGKVVVLVDGKELAVEPSSVTAAGTPVAHVAAGSI